MSVCPPAANTTAITVTLIVPAQCARRGLNIRQLTYVSFCNLQ
jgi:hypothetical protein